MCVLKVGVPIVGLEPFGLQGEALGLELLVAMGRCTGIGVYGRAGSHGAPTCFDVAFFSFARCVVVTQQRRLFVWTCRLSVSVGGSELPSCSLHHDAC